MKKYKKKKITEKNFATNFFKKICQFKKYRNRDISIYCENSKTQLNFYFSISFDV